MKKVGSGLVAAIVVIAVGTAHFVAENGRSFFDNLDGWVSSTETGARKVDSGHEAAVDFKVKPLPFSLGDLTKDDAAGKFDGTLIEASENRLKKIGGFSDEETRRLGCFLTTKAVNGELSLDPEIAAEQILEYVIEGVPGIEERAAANEFRDALVDAKSDGEAAFHGALAYVCSPGGDELLE
jgi:hypothetical protein